MHVEATSDVCPLQAKRTRLGGNAHATQAWASPLSPAVAAFCRAENHVLDTVLTIKKAIIYPNTKETKQNKQAQTILRRQFLRERPCLRLPRHLFL